MPFPDPITSTSALASPRPPRSPIRSLFATFSTAASIHSEERARMVLVTEAQQPAARLGHQDVQFRRFAEV